MESDKGSHCSGGRVDCLREITPKSDPVLRFSGPITNCKPFQKACLLDFLVSREAINTVNAHC